MAEGGKVREYGTRDSAAEYEGYRLLAMEEPNLALQAHLVNTAGRGRFEHCRRHLSRAQPGQRMEGESASMMTRAAVTASGLSLLWE